MYLRSARVQNYRSILDSGELSFSPGFNLVVGANNVGKSSLLLCLAAKFGGEPHKSIHTLPSRDEPLNPMSRVDLTLVANGDEVRRMLISSGSGLRNVPWPADLRFVVEHIDQVLPRFFATAAIPFRISAQAPTGNSAPNWTIEEYPATRLYEPLVEGGHNRMLQFQVNSASRSITPVGLVESAPAAQDFGQTLSQQIAQRIYRFSAERLSLGMAEYGANTELAPDARNLPEVLNILQGNPERFREYSDLVREVFPTIQKVSLRPSPSRQAEILVWQVDPKLQRDDLAMPLMQCGTGVGQVLAMLYVAKISEQPRTIIIDEPGSFLHPGASRALIGILKRFTQHQYIVATHSPEILSELSNAPVTIIRWDDSTSAIEQSPCATGKVAATALAEVGARLGDVFGFDKVLWVEGQSDALSLAALLEAVGKPQRRVGILPVRDTGSFRRRKIAEVIEIYRTLSLGGALLPPAIMFLFDRDGRSAKEIEDATRASGNKLRFLPRRMLENYLLNALAIARVFNEAGSEHKISTTADIVQRWMEDHGSAFCKGSENLGPSSNGWLERVDGAALLEQLFADLSAHRLQYKKTVHTPRLTVVSQEIDPESTREIIELVADVIE